VAARTQTVLQNGYNNIMLKLYHRLEKNGSFLEETFLIFLLLCSLTDKIYEKFIKMVLYERRYIVYNKNY